VGLLNLRNLEKELGIDLNDALLSEREGEPVIGVEQLVLVK
jgi:hypothetical protein